MDNWVVTYVYLYVALFPLLAVGAAYYTYRIMKTTGSFRGWTLLLVFMIAFASQGVAIFGIGNLLSLFSNPSQMSEYLQQVDSNSLLRTSSYNLLLAATLFAAMFEIDRIFMRVKNSSLA